MCDLKNFRKVNGLKQDDLAEYLGVAKSFISQIENGKNKLSEAKLSKLLNNPFDWDTAALTEIPVVSVKTSGKNNRVMSIVGNGNKAVNNDSQPEDVNYWKSLAEKYRDDFEREREKSEKYLAMLEKAMEKQ